MEKNDAQARPFKVGDEADAEKQQKSRRKKLIGTVGPKSSLEREEKRNKGQNGREGQPNQERTGGSENHKKRCRYWTWWEKKKA